MSCRMRFRVPAAVLALALAALLVPPEGALARARDHDEARRAVEAGQARPLNEILDIVRGKLPGEIIRVKFERQNGEWMYEFRLVDRSGRLFEVYVDARTGEIGRVREK